MTHDQAQPFNEDAALAELERLRQAIMAARRARQQKSDEFEAFVQGFRKPAPVPPAERPVARTATANAPMEASRPLVVEAPPATPLSPAVVPEQTHAIDEGVADAPAPAAPRARPRVRWPIALGATIGLIALGLLATRSRNQPPAPDSATRAPDTRVAPEPGETPAPPAQQATAPVQEPARAVTLDLRTLQSVWMRVVVDGEKKSEGMVQGGQSLHFGADDSIVVRVGNGGAVVVKTGDREHPFGAVDQPVTRRFAKQ